MPSHDGHKNSYATESGRKERRIGRARRSGTREFALGITTCPRKSLAEMRGQAQGGQRERGGRRSARVYPNAKKAFGVHEGRAMTISIGH